MAPKTSQQYGEGVHWAPEAIRFGEPSRRYLDQHQNSKTHKAAIKQNQMFLRMFVKGSIYKQIITGAGNSNQSDVEHNRRVIKKFMKTVYSFFWPEKIWFAISMEL